MTAILIILTIQLAVTTYLVVAVLLLRERVLDGVSLELELRDPEGLRIGLTPGSEFRLHDVGQGGSSEGARDPNE